MPRLSAFTPFGHFAFSGAPSHGQSIYETMLASFGDAFDSDFTSVHAARLYAIAMCLAASQYQLDRALNNRNPETATELLPALEHDYQVIPNQKATIDERRAYVAAIKKVSRGCRHDAMESILSTLLGSDFIGYSTPDPADIVATPSSPGTVGVFSPPGTRKKLFQITDPIATLGTSIVVGITVLGGTEPPLIGEKFCVDPDPHRGTEQITIEGISGAVAITATFTKSHEPGTLAVYPHPYWISNQRVDTVTATLAAATNPETRRKLNELMRRAVRVVSIWQIVQGTTPGYFTTDDAVLGLPDINLVY